MPRGGINIKDTGWARFDPSLPGSKPVAKKTADRYSLVPVITVTEPVRAPGPMSPRIRAGRFFKEAAE
jgi:hypothetical protein